jgi:hypothetical protein
MLCVPTEQAFVELLPGDRSHQKSCCTGIVGSGVNFPKFDLATAELCTHDVVLVAYCMLQNWAASPKLNRNATSSPVLAATPVGVLIPPPREANAPTLLNALFFTVKSRSLAEPLSVFLNQLFTTLRAFDIW